MISLIATLGASVGLWFCARTWLKPTTSAIVVLLFAGNAQALRWSMTGISEPTYLFSVLILLIFFRNAIQTPSPYKELGLGVLLGFIALLRPQGIVWTLAVGVGWLFLKSPGSAARTLGIALMIWGGVLLRNHFSIWDLRDSGGLAIWLAHAMATPPTQILLQLARALSALALIVLGIRFIWKKSMRNRAWLVTILTGCGLSITFHLVWPTEESRSYLTLLPFVCLFMGVGYESLSSRTRWVVGVIAILLLIAPLYELL